MSPNKSTIFTSILFHTHHTHIKPIPIIYRKMFFTYYQTRNRQPQTQIRPQPLQTHQRQSPPSIKPSTTTTPEPNIFMDNVAKYQMQANMFGRINFGLPCSGCKK